jgi:hypothetical protein
VEIRALGKRKRRIRIKLTIMMIRFKTRMMKYQRKTNQTMTKASRSNFKTNALPGIIKIINSLTKTKEMMNTRVNKIHLKMKRKKKRMKRMMKFRRRVKAKIELGVMVTMLMMIVMSRMMKIKRRRVNIIRIRKVLRHIVVKVVNKSKARDKVVYLTLHELSIIIL